MSSEDAVGSGEVVGSAEPGGPQPSIAGDRQQPEFGRAPAPRRRVRPLWWVVIAVVVVAGAVATVLATTTGGSGGGESPAATQFDTAYQAFHKSYALDSAALTSDLSHASAIGELTFGGTWFSAATRDAKALAAAYQQYATAVGKITVPLNARNGAAEILNVAKAGNFLMTQASDFFTPSGMHSVLDAQWPRLQTDMAGAEDDVRQILGLPQASPSAS